MGHNAACATYSVDFGEKDVTSQEVPDSQIATIGGPELLRSAAENKNCLVQGGCSTFSLLGKSVGNQRVCNAYSY